MGQLQSAEALRQQLLELRPPPLTNLDVRVHLNVQEFGAVPNDGKDDRSAVESSPRKAKSLEGPVQIDFDPGLYDFEAASADFLSKDADAVLLLDHCRDLIIDGHGAKILIHRQDISFSKVTSSTNIIVRDFSIDYDPLPFSQGTVRKVFPQDGSFVLELHPGFPAPDDSFFKNFDSWGMLKDRKKPGRLKEKCPSFFMYSSVSALGKTGFESCWSGRRRFPILSAGISL